MRSEDAPDRTEPPLGDVGRVGQLDDEPAPTASREHDLDLLRPIYTPTAAYGHFGRDLPDFTWERTDRVEALRSACGQ